MTRMNETNPKPSQPRSRIIMCGIKISRFMDKINNRTKMVNRDLNLSSSMYILENDNTLEEINITTILKISPVLSAIMVKLSGEQEVCVRAHSMIIILSYIIE